jgi:hypothetical protein
MYDLRRARPDPEPAESLDSTGFVRQVAAVSPMAAFGAIEPSGGGGASAR